MTRYVALHRPPVGWGSNLPHNMEARPSIVVEEADKSPIATGLCDAAGVPLYRVPEAVPMGFQARPRVRVKAGSR